MSEVVVKMKRGRFAAAVLVFALGAWIITLQPTGAPARKHVPAVQPQVAAEAAEIEDDVLVGRVVDLHRDMGVMGASVSIVCAEADAEKVFETRCDARGRFRFQTLPTGRCTLRASAPGYLVGGPQGNRPVRLRIREGEYIKQLDVPLIRAARLAGIAVDGDTPVSNVALTLLYLEAPGENEAFSESTGVITDAEGRFEIPQALPGRLQILAEHEDYALVESEVFFLHPGDVRSDLTLRLASAARIEGRVVDQAGAGVSGARVALKLSGFSEQREVIADRHGAFVIDSVPPGQVALRVRARGYDGGDGTQLSVALGQVLEVELEVARIEGFGGIVLGPDGHPISRALVRFIAPDGTPLPLVRGRRFATRSDEEGRFWLKDVPYYPVACAATHFGLAPSAAVTVAGDGEEVVLTMGFGGGLYGRVVDGSGEPITAYKVHARRIAKAGSVRGSRVAMNVVDTAGAFHFESLAPGEYAVEVAVRGRPLVVAESFTVAGGSDTDVGNIVVSLGGTLVGVVVDASTDLPIAGVLLQVDGMNRGPHRNAAPRTRTDAEGRFMLRGLPDEPISVVLHARRGYVTRMETGIHVADGDTIDLGEIAMTPSVKGIRQMQYQGVGMALRKVGDALVVQQIFDGTPAQEMGFEKGMEILTVNGYEVADMSLREAVELIRGESGTEVALTILGPGADYTETLNVARGEVTADVQRRRRVRRRR